MRQILDRTIGNKLVFKIVLLTALLLNIVPYLHEQLGGYMKILLIWGLFLTCYDILRNPGGLIASRGMLFLLLFAFCYAITILLNYRVYFTENIKALIYMFMFFVLLYGNDIKQSKEQMKKEIRIVAFVIIGITFVFACICFATFLLSVSYKYKADGTNIYMGMSRNRLWGLYNPNVGASLNIVSAFLSLFLLLERMGETLKRKGAKVVRGFLIANLLIQYCCLVLTGSRTAQYSMYVGVGLLAYLMAGMLKKKQIFTKIAIALLSMAILFGAVEVSRFGLSYLPKLFQTTAQASESGNLDRKDTSSSSKGGILNGRQYLWKAALEQFNENPFFGVTRENNYNAMKKHIAQRTYRRALRLGGVHNIYLTVLVSSGLFGFVIMGIFLLVSLMQVLSYLQGLENVKKNIWFLGNLILVFIFLVMELFENRILYQVNIFYAMFWMFLGYTIYFTEKARDEKKVGIQQDEPFILE